MYKHDQNKLYRVHNILRWGIPKDGGIYFEEMIDGCGTYLPYFTTIKYIPLFVVAEKNRYPTAAEFAEFSYDNEIKRHWLTVHMGEEIVKFFKNGV